MTRHLALLSLVIVAACGSDDPKVDPSLTQDLALAGQVQQAALPTFQDSAPAPDVPVPAEASPPVRRTERPVVLRDPAPRRTEPTPQPVVEAPAPAPVAAAPSRTIGAGTSIGLTSMARVCTSTNRPGDKIVATVNSAVTGSNGAVIPAGASVVLEVVSAENGNGNEAGSLTFRVRSIVVGDESYAAYGDVIPVTPVERTKIADASGGDKKKVIGGAIAGAIAGRILGGSNKGAVIGAAAGGAAGAVVARSGERTQSCLPQGAALRVELRDAVIM